jgi:preprotein translocase subunit SecG
LQGEELQQPSVRDLRDTGIYCNNGRLGNSVVGTTETAGAGIMSVLAMVMPVIAAVFAIILLILVIVYGRKAWRKLRHKKKITDPS